MFAPRIKPMAMSKKCCECRPDLNPYQANRCKHEGRGIPVYDRGQLVTDFAKLPDDCYESDQRVYAYDSKYDSDGSFDFEKKLMPPASKQTADSPASIKDTAAKTVEPLPHKPSVTADPDTESEDLVATDTSDSESDTPAAAAPADSPVPQIACSDAPLTSLLAKAVAMGIEEIRANDKHDLQKYVAQEIQKLRPILVSDVQQILQQQQANEQAIAASSSQQLQHGWERVEENVQAKLSGAVTMILEKTRLMLDQRLPPRGINPFDFPDVDPFQPETDIMGNPVPMQTLGHKRPSEVKPDCTHIVQVCLIQRLTVTVCHRSLWVDRVVHRGYSRGASVKSSETPDFFSLVSFKEQMQYSLAISN